MKSAGSHIGWPTPGDGKRRTLLLAAVALAIGCSSDSTQAKLPFGLVDAPQQNQTLRGRVVASGWALSEDRVTRVSAYIDRTYFKDATLGGNRPDVTKVYPGFPEGDQSGWTVELDADKVPEGKHDLLFRAESSKGAVRDLGSVSVVIAH